MEQVSLLVDFEGWSLKNVDHDLDKYSFPSSALATSLGDFRQDDDRHNSELLPGAAGQRVRCQRAYRFQGRLGGRASLAGRENYLEGAPMSRICDLILMSETLMRPTDFLPERRQRQREAPRAHGPRSASGEVRRKQHHLPGTSQICGAEGGWRFCAALSSGVSLDSSRRVLRRRCP